MKKASNIWVRRGLLFHRLHGQELALALLLKQKPMSAPQISICWTEYITPPTEILPPMSEPSFFPYIRGDWPETAPPGPSLLRHTPQPQTSCKQKSTRAAFLSESCPGTSYVGAFSTALKPLSGHLVAAASALQAKERRNLKCSCWGVPAPNPASYYLKITWLWTTGSTRTDAHRRRRTIKRLAVHSVLSQPNQINQLALVMALLTVIQHSTLTAIYTTIVRDNPPTFKLCQKFSNLLAVKAYFFFQKERANLWSRHRFLF